MKEHLIIAEGKVQGVCFRALVQERAQEKALKGYVKNLPNGSVEICLQGDEQTILLFLHELQKDAGLASIAKLSSKIQEAKKSFDRFMIVR